MDQYSEPQVSSNTRKFVDGGYRFAAKKSSSKLFLQQVNDKIFSHLNSHSVASPSINAKSSNNSSSKSTPEEPRRSSSSYSGKQKSSTSVERKPRISDSVDNFSASTPKSRKTNRRVIEDDSYDDDSYCTPTKQISRDINKKFNPFDVKSKSFSSCSDQNLSDGYVKKELQNHRLLVLQRFKHIYNIRKYANDRISVIIPCKYLCCTKNRISNQSNGCQFIAKSRENGCALVRKSFANESPLHRNRKNTDVENDCVTSSSRRISSDSFTPIKKTFPERSSRLSERYTSSTTGPAVCNTPYRKRRSDTGDMDFSPSFRRPTLCGKAFYKTEMKSTYFMDQLNEFELESARNILQTETNSAVPYVDTHCHLDFLFKRMAFYNSVDEYFEKTFFKFPKNFEGCITDWCQPSLYPRATPVLKASSEKFKLWGAIGCHPHFVSAYNDATEKQIEFHLNTFANVVAWGEMGLDYSDRFGRTDHNLQKSVFIRQLQQATRRNLPLVIHCRDADPDLYDIMTRYVPHDTKIHRHCLTTEEKDVRGLLDYFPNCYVGFTNLLTNRSAYRPRDAVAKIPLERIILETDAPYFVPRCVADATSGNAKWSHPGMASCVAGEISYIKDIPVKGILETIRDNVSRLYGI